MMVLSISASGPAHQATVIIVLILVTSSILIYPSGGNAIAGTYKILFAFDLLGNYQWKSSMGQCSGPLPPFSDLEMTKVTAAIGSM
jgi:hypothetical protein